MPSQCDNRRKPLHAASLLSAAAGSVLGCTTRKLRRFIGKTCPLYGVLLVRLTRPLAAPARTTYAPQHSAPSAKQQLCRLSPGQIQHSPGSEAASSHKIRSRNGTWTEFASTGNHTVLHSHVFLVRLAWPTWRLSDRQNFGIAPSYDEPCLCIV